MEEPHPNNEQDFPKPLVDVAVDERRMGELISEKGGSFNLQNFFGDASMLLGADAFSRLYLRTESGNIYQLDRQGRLVNGKLSETQKRIHAIQLDAKAPEAAKITVGEPFEFGGGHTTKITEIVATNEKYYHPDYLKTLTRGRKTTIYNDFMKMIPPKDAPEVQSLEKPIPEIDFKTQSPGFFYRFYRRFKR